MARLKTGEQRKNSKRLTMDGNKRGLFAAYYLYKTIRGCRSFLKQYPYMKKYWWAVILADYLYLAYMPWACLTLGSVSSSSVRCPWHYQLPPKSESLSNKSG